MTLKYPEASWPHAARMALRHGPRLVLLAWRYHAAGKFDSVLDALDVVQSPANRKHLGDKYAQQLGESAEDEGRESMFTMAPVMRRFEARPQVRRPHRPKARPIESRGPAVARTRPILVRRPVVQRPQASRTRRTARTVSRFAAPSKSADPEPGGESDPPYRRQFSPQKVAA